jgi:type I restriction enzyme S subunit
MTFYKETNLQETQIGKIPQDWKSVLINQISEVRRGASPRPIGDPKYFSDKGRGWVRISDVTETYKYLRKTSQYLSELGESKSVKVNPGDLIMSICATIGRPILVDMEACIHDGFVVFRNLSKGVDTEFLFYVLQKYQSRFASMRQTGTQGNLNTNLVGSTLIPLPPFGEQRRIVGVLGVVDLAIAKTGEVIAKTERLKKGLMQELLTKGIGHKEHKQTPIGKILKEWKIEKIGNICKVVTGGTPSTKHPEYFGGNIKWLKSGDIKKLYIYDTEEKITQLGVENSNAKIHPANSVAIALSGRGQTRGRTTIIKEPMACSQSVAIMIPNSELLPEYMHYNLSNRYLEIRNLTGHLDRSGLNLSIVSDIEIPIPSLAEQEKMTSILITIDKKLELERDEKAKLERVKWGLMDLLLTGKVRVKVD